jgi:hypothetical protein
MDAIVRYNRRAGNLPELPQPEYWSVIVWKRQISNLGGTDFRRYQSRSGMEQEPGPRGSPQLPQGPGAMGVADEDPLACTANTESCDARFLPLHFGQLAFSFPSSRASKG